MCSHAKLPPTLITTPTQKSAHPLSQRNYKAKDVVQGAVKCIKFSSEDHDDVAAIRPMQYEALKVEIRWQLTRLRWYDETLEEDKMKAKLHLRLVKIMKVGVRIAKRRKAFQRFSGKEAVQIMKAEARKRFELFCEYARCVVSGYNWDRIIMEYTFGLDTFKM